MIYRKICHSFKKWTIPTFIFYDNPPLLLDMNRNQMTLMYRNLKDLNFQFIVNSFYYSQYVIKLYMKVLKNVTDQPVKKDLDC